ncbi:MAG: transposase [Clostridia bacterium]|nr:transposase [Clostridia bacterium]MBR0537743.1 transposase [Clostridia bacterium]
MTNHLPTRKKNRLPKEVYAYCIMPDHIHLLISLRPDETASGKTSIQNVVGCFKARTTKAIGTGKTVWQKGFYDHIVRGQEDFDSVRQYIQFNPYIYLEKKKEGKS